MVMTLLTRPKKTVATVVIATDGSGDFNCDGTSDDVEIQAAIDSLPATGGCIYMKEGTYNITDPIYIINNNISIIGCGRSTILTAGILILGDDMINVTGNNCTLDNFSMLWYANVASACIQCSSSSGHLITKIYIDSNVNEGISFNPSVIDSIISNNFLTSTDAISGGRIGLTDGCVGNIISNNVCDTCVTGIGITTECNNNLIIGNICRNCDRNGIYLNTNSDSNIISNNNIYNNGARYYPLTIDEGISIAAGSDNNIISNNKINNNTAYGINLTNSEPPISPVAVNNNFVHGNYFINNTELNIVDTGTNTQIFNNIEL